MLELLLSFLAVKSVILFVCAADEGEDEDAGDDPAEEPILSSWALWQVCIIEDCALVVIVLRSCCNGAD